MEVIGRFFKPPPTSFFLFGPRGTGKSTWLRRVFPDALWIDLLEQSVCREYLARPERLLAVVRASRGRRTVVIDEIQKAPEVLSSVHLLIEKSRSRRFVLTGSSARKLKRAGVNLLGGRALLRTMHPFMAAELGARFDLGSALMHGLLPVVVSSRRPGEVLRAYASLYLREEVQAEGLVRSIGGFARFLEAVSFSHAAPLNVSAVARDCQVERKVVEGYVEVLEDLLLAFRLPVFARRARRATAVHPKLFLFDAGVFRSLRPCGPLDRPEEIDGAALEGLVAQHLRAWNEHRGAPNSLSYWRTRSGVEVDFVLYGPDGLWAIEVKNSSRVRPEDLRSLRAFRHDYPVSKTLLLYRGQERLEEHGVLCLPCSEFLVRLHPRRRLEAATR